VAPDEGTAPTAPDDLPPLAQDAGSGDVEDDEGEPPTDGEESGGGVIEAPASWDAEAKARIAELPRGLQDYLSTREGERERAVSTAQREAAEIRQRAHGELGLVQQLTEQLEAVLPEVLAAHRERWGAEPDWEALAKEKGVDEAFRQKVQWEKESARIAQLAQHKREAESLAHARFVADELEKLKTVAPPLADLRDGPGRRAAMGRYLMDQGASAEQLRSLGALEAGIAYKAMLWDQAQASLRPAAGARAAITAPRPNLRPGAGQPHTPHQRSVDGLTRRLSQTGTVDDAVALLNARKRS
jgi:hypothetical protein